MTRTVAFCLSKGYNQLLYIPLQIYVIFYNMNNKVEKEDTVSLSDFNEDDLAHELSNIVADPVSELVVTSAALLPSANPVTVPATSPAVGSSVETNPIESASVPATSIVDDLVIDSTSVPASNVVTTRDEIPQPPEQITDPTSDTDTVYLSMEDDVDTVITTQEYYAASTISARPSSHVMSNDGKSKHILK